MSEHLKFQSIKFEGYKALRDVTVRLAHMNILVGSNNHGKSTIIGAFRVLTQGLTQMRTRKSIGITGPKGPRPGWEIPEDSLPISFENIHTNYESIPTLVTFTLSNSTYLYLYFPPDGGCFIFGDHEGNFIRRPLDLKKIPIDITVVPVLGPLEHREQPVLEETVRKNLITTRRLGIFVTIGVSILAVLRLLLHWSPKLGPEWKSSLQS